ncbi:MAG: hypothetical protein J6X69_04790 [Bacteroidales bacterium]|nr:hypothetical protein [Bacteroidales bacterium]
MKKTFNYLLAIVALAGCISCSKTSVPEGQVAGASQTEQASDVPETEQASDVPEGYVKLYFDAYMPSDEEMPQQQTKMAMSGLSVVWQGTETINIWYKDANNAVQHTAATIESYSGKKAILSAVFPETAPKDEFIAELNGVSDADKLPFGQDSTRPRVNVSATQTATLGSFDPSAYAMGARWVGTSGEKPSFRFKNLVNLLKITVDNNTGKTLKKIVLSNDVSIASKNYWSIGNDDTPAITGSTTGSKFITLSGDSIADGDYYFVLSTNNNNAGSFTLSNMDLVFWFDDNSICPYSNSKSLSLSRGTLSQLGAFSIESGDLMNGSSVIPFGTQWKKGAVKAWYDSGKYESGQDYELEATSTASHWMVTPKGLIKSTSGPNQYGNSIPGQFDFRFVVANTGRGTLTYTAKSGKTTSPVYVTLNDVVQPDGTIDVTEDTEKTVSFDVVKGDEIRIYQSAGTGAGRIDLYWNSTDTPIKWERAAAE